MKITTCFSFLLLVFFSSCKERSTEAQVVDWISDHAIPLNTTQPGSGWEDLRPTGEIIGDARIVSLGEPTHGNREVFQLKHRMIEYLVSEMGFHVFALECPFGEAFDVNRYVLDGIGDPEKALAAIYYWTWDTQEVLELLKWLRAYNADPAHEKKVKFYGFDPQDPERAARVMLAHLARVDPELAEKVNPELGILQVPFSNPEIAGRRQYIPQEYDALSLQEIRRVMRAFDLNKDRYIAASSPSEWTIARQHARQVEMYIDQNTNDGQNYKPLRELGQAENIKWITDQEGEEAKVIVWAHNIHVANASIQGFDLMGAHLRRWYGDQLKIFGLFFNQGGFKALDVDMPSRGMYDFSVGPAPKGTLEYLMASAGLTHAVVDLHQLPEKGPVRDWFHQKHPSRHSGGGYQENKPEEYLRSYTLAEAFDALVYLDATTPVHSINESDYDPIWLLNKKLEQPANLDFEANSPGEAPDDWVVWSKFQRLGVQLLVDGDNPYHGAHSAIIHRPEGISYGEIAPNLTQRIDAAPYRGKTIRLRAAARAELQEPAFAFLRLVIEPGLLQSAHDGATPLFDSLDSERIESSAWKIYEIEAEVAEEADFISYGIYLRDSGSVWIDFVRIDID